MKSGIKISVSIIALLTVLFSFNQCVAEKKGATKATTKKTASAPSPATGDAGDIENGNELPDGLTMPPINSPTEPSENDEIDVGVKNFEQINASMSTLTGVPVSNTGILSLYNQLNALLPSDNNVQTVIPATQTAVIKLASEYCDKLVEDATLRARVWPTINFAQNPPVAFTPTNKALIISQAITSFLPPLQANEQEVARTELVLLFDELLTGESLTTNVTTKKVIKGMCMATLSSSHTILL